MPASTRSAAPTVARRGSSRPVFKAPKLDSLLSGVVVADETFDRPLPRPRNSYAMIDVAGGARDTGNMR